MDVDIFVALHLIAIPFLSELEHIDLVQWRKRGVFSILRLRYFFSQRWSYGYCTLAILVMILVVSPSASGRRHVVPISMLVVAGVIQVILWLYAYLRLSRRIKGEGGER